MMHKSQIEVKRRGLILVLSGPSGAGKSTITKAVIEQDPHINLSVSFTTRKMRRGEIDGVHYYFVDNEKFLQMVEQNSFLEYANVMGNYYGTKRQIVESTLSAGHDLLFDIDWQGHRQLVSHMREDIVSIFILPPTIAKLNERLILRNQDASDTIRMRMESAMLEISKWTEYDYVIINDDNIAKSIEKVLHILRAERLKKVRRTGLPDFIHNILKPQI